jgi:hypothetical protein
LADDKRPRQAYGDGMDLLFSDRRRRDWLLAGVLTVASLVQLWLGPGPVHAQVLSSLFATAVCVTVAFRQRYPTTAGVTAQAIMVLDFDTWHNLQLGAWTIAWWCSLYGLAVWSTRRRFVAGLAFAVFTDLLHAGRNTSGPVLN